MIGVQKPALATATILLTLLTPLRAADTPTFAKDVAPILTANCAGCHSGNVAMGTLDLDSFPGIQKGGHSGSVIVPGKSAESLLYLRITGKVAPSMPLNGKKLADTEIETIRLWIDSWAAAAGKLGGEIAARRRPAIPDIKPLTRVKPLIGSLSRSGPTASCWRWDRLKKYGWWNRKRACWSPRFRVRPKTSAR